MHDNIPEPLAAYRSRLVRRVAATDTPASAALFNLAASGRKEWTPADWEIILWDIDHSTDTVAAFCERMNPCTTTA